MRSVALDERCRQIIKVSPVARTDDPVCRGEREPKLVLWWREIVVDLAVQDAGDRPRHAPRPDRVEHLRHLRITELAKNLRQVDGREPLSTVRAGREEIRGAKSGREVVFFSRVDHGRQLVEVSDQDQLDSSKRLPRVWPVFFEGEAHLVEQVGSHHRRFINDECVD